MLSPIWRVVELINVFVPFTVKSPLIVTFVPLAVIAALSDDVNVFNDVFPLLALNEFKLEVLSSILLNLAFADAV